MAGVEEQQAFDVSVRFTRTKGSEAAKPHVAPPALRVKSAVTPGYKRTRDRLELLVRAGEMFHQSLILKDTLFNVARVAVESFADLCLFDLLDEKSDRLYVTIGTHRDESLEPMLKAMGSSLLYDSENGMHPAVRVAQTGLSFFVSIMDDEQIELHAGSAAHAEFMRRLGYRSKIIVPVAFQSRTYGALTFVRTATCEPFDARDVQFAEELGRRAGLAVANAKQFDHEKHVAATLQNVFLAEQLPSRPRLTLHALYRPSDDLAKLGGDWYDAFHTPDGSTVVTIGDVSGKGIDAARTMVQVRHSIRVAATISRDPSEILRIVNDVMFLDHAETLATTFVGVLSADLTRLTYSSAGHPPAFLRREDGQIEALSTGSQPLGIVSQTLFDSVHTDIDANCLLLMYTDGLSEIERDAITGEADILTLLESEAVLHANNPARFFERLFASHDRHDDIAIMTARLGKRDESEWRIDVGDPAVAYALQTEILAHATSLGSASADERGACTLIVSELIANVVRHAPGALSIAIAAEADGVWLHLIDEGPGFEFRPSLPADVWSESGRGLFLVAALARSIEVESLPGRGAYLRVRLPIDVQPETIALIS